MQKDGPALPARDRLFFIFFLSEPSQTCGCGSPLPPLLRLGESTAISVISTNTAQSPVPTVVLPAIVPMRGGKTSMPEYAKSATVLTPLAGITPDTRPA